MSETFVPEEKLAVHVPGQLIPAGLLVTVPVPEEVTVSGDEPAEKVALTVSAPVISTLQPAAPEQAPLQPLNV